ncbi:hypothetical protein [Rhizobium sp. RU36D]|uniref:hypothetical protein n=1 Tax=Rhizobium sp. RU36D TaxID=1907415 RepID=UPI0015C47E94|nr:hypothetical protein [Rhizobium sp. RU36D]
MLFVSVIIALIPARSPARVVAVQRVHEDKGGTNCGKDKGCVGESPCFASFMTPANASDEAFQTDLKERLEI